MSRPVRTYNTAAVYYHKFRLVHPDSNGYIVSIRNPEQVSSSKSVIGRCGGSTFCGVQDRGHTEKVKGDPLCCVQFETCTRRAAYSR